MSNCMPSKTIRESRSCCARAACDWLAEYDRWVALAPPFAPWRCITSPTRPSRHVSADLAVGPIPKKVQRIINMGSSILFSLLCNELTFRWLQCFIIFKTLFLFLIDIIFNKYTKSALSKSYTKYVFLKDVGFIIKKLSLNISSTLVYILN